MLYFYQTIMNGVYRFCHNIMSRCCVVNNLTCLSITEATRFSVQVHIPDILDIALQNVKITDTRSLIHLVLRFLLI